MKTIIISDIKAAHESIIPYALNFAKHISERAAIVHPIDTRKKHAVSSAYADSQTFERGEKLSYDKVLERDKHQAETALSNLLSKEASKLNYPLRVDTLVDVSSLTEGLNTVRKDKRPPFIIVSAEPDGEVIESQDEYFVMLEYMGGYTLIVPPGLTFQKPSKAMMVYDLEKDENDNVIDLLNMLSPLEMHINLVDVMDMENYPEADMKSKSWVDYAEKILNGKLRITSNVLTGEDYSETIINFFQRNQYDFIIVPQVFSPAKGLSPFPNELHKTLIDKLHVPVMIYT